MKKGYTHTEFVEKTKEEITSRLDGLPYKIEHENTIGYVLNFDNRSELMVGYKDFFVELQNDFDPTHKGATGTAGSFT